MSKILRYAPSQCPSHSLLTIENSYIEGVDILYRTNTFHISSLPLLLNLARLMPPRHLATITSVELLWDLLKTLRL